MKPAYLQHEKSQRIISNFQLRLVVEVIRCPAQEDIAGVGSPSLSTKACDKIVNLHSKPLHPVQKRRCLLRRMAFARFSPKAFRASEPPAKLLAGILNRSNRTFLTCPIWQTDGVYRDLTNMRVRTPWIQALRESKKEAATMPGKPAKPASRDLKAKRMADSFHRVVRGEFLSPNCEYT